VVHAQQSRDDERRSARETSADNHAIREIHDRDVGVYPTRTGQPQESSVPVSMLDSSPFVARRLSSYRFRKLGSAGHRASDEEETGEKTPREGEADAKPVSARGDGRWPHCLAAGALTPEVQCCIIASVHVHCGAVVGGELRARDGLDEVVPGQPEHKNQRWYTTPQSPLRTPSTELDSPCRGNSCAIER
jgi:hypothetical protein